MSYTASEAWEDKKRYFLFERAYCEKEEHAFYYSGCEETRAAALAKRKEFWAMYTRNR